MSVKVDISGHLGVKKTLQLLQQTPAKRKRILGQVGRKVRVASRQRLRQQRDINGRPWAPRKSQSKRKMLRGLSKRMAVYSDPKKVDITFDNGVVGKIARAQQEGIATGMTAQKMQRIHGEPDYGAPATRSQAKALRAEGYKIRRANGKGWKNATLKWITENLTIGQAGIILRLMRDKASTSSWVIPLPARSFLGASEKDVNAMVDTIFENTLNRKRA